MQPLVHQAFFIATVLGVSSGVPTLHYHVEASEEMMERAPIGCCYENKLIDPGATMCADERTTVQCVRDNGILQLIVKDGEKCSVKTKEQDGNRGCAPTNCLYKGRKVSSRYSKLAIFVLKPVL